jgi:glutathione synthase/RimK-type ligase-like ATP-grasp enzyme
VLALVTCAEAIGLDTDLPLLTAHLDADIVVWDDARVEWAAYDTVIVRSAWDYPARRDEFVSWATRVDAVTNLWNPLELIVWNTDKRYLGELAATGLPVVPSWFVTTGDALPSDLDLSADLVVKPTVGGGSRGVMRTSDPGVARAHIAALHDDGLVAMVQPYRASIDDDGETGLVYVGGDFSHSFEKSAILAAPIEWEGNLYVKETVCARVASATQRALADTVVASLPPTAYARIDLVPGDDGPEILEVELTEPSLFLDTDPEAPARAAAAFRNLAS